MWAPFFRYREQLMPTQLQPADFVNAAAEIGCSTACVQAVAEVESAGSGFLADGRAKILFEGHVFHRLTGGIHDHSHPEISYSKWTRRFYLGSAAEYDRLEKAAALNRMAARMSASYGRFQIMGFNHRLCGFEGIDAFYDAMQTSEALQLLAFCRYICGRDLQVALVHRDWVYFAAAYNGPDYWKNQYDKRLAQAYSKYA